mmetsp:Transcript_27450/g.91300  ORF Transcript_27450/g.91300 Transcript_27450/m.91300 type:complete len:269 (+) Transcript_27450:51-857(+)
MPSTKRAAHSVLAELKRDLATQPKRPRSSSLLTAPVRKELIRRMREACDEFRSGTDESDRRPLQPFVVGHAAAYLDRYVATQASLSNVNLTAAVCLLLATKFCDVCCPQLDELCELFEVGGPKGCAKQTVKAAERHIAESLGWDMNVITPHALLPPLLELVSATGQTQRIAEEMILESYEAHPLEHRPLTVAAASIMATWHFLSDLEAETCHTEELARLCDVNLSELLKCTYTLASTFNASIGTVLGGRTLVDSPGSVMMLTHDLSSW